MEEAEETAAEAEAEGHGGLRLEGKRCVVEAEFFEGVAEHGVFVRVDGVEAGEDHALDVFEAGERLGTGVFDRGDGVANFGVGYVLDCRDEEAYFACGKLCELNGLGGHDADTFDVEDFAVGHDLDLHALAELAVDDAGEDGDASVGIEPAIEDEGLERGFRVALRRRGQRDDGFEDAGYVEAGLGADGAGEIDLVDDWNDLKAVGDGEIGVCEGLGFDALRGIDDEECALAGGQGAGDLVGEVDVAGGVDEVELV